MMVMVMTAIIARPSRQICGGSVMILATISADRIRAFSTVLPRSVHARPVVDGRAARITFLCIIIRIDRCFIIIGQRKLLAPVPRGIAARDLVVPLARRVIVQRFRRVKARTRLGRATRFTMMAERRTRELRNTFRRFNSLPVRRSRHYIASAEQEEGRERLRGMLPRASFRRAQYRSFFRAGAGSERAQRVALVSLIVQPDAVRVRSSSVDLPSANSRREIKEAEFRSRDQESREYKCEPVPVGQFCEFIFTVGTRHHYRLVALSARHGIDRVSATAIVPQLRNVLADVPDPAAIAADRALFAAGTIVIAASRARRTDVIGSGAARASHQRAARSRLINGTLVARRGFHLERRIRQRDALINRLWCVTLPEAADTQSHEYAISVYEPDIYFDDTFGPDVQTERIAKRRN